MQPTTEPNLRCDKNNITQKIPQQYTDTLEQRINFLKQCAVLYESQGSSPLTDEEYDKEYATLKQLDPENPFFKSVGGLDDHIYGTRVKHDIIMGSLNKDPTLDDFKKWLLGTFPEGTEVDFLLQHKIDGSSLSIVYQSKQLHHSVTRGNGTIGLDVTPNVKTIRGVPHSVNFPSVLEVRGEGYKDRKDFYENWAGEYTIPRNFTAGSINQIDPEVTRVRGLSFLAYEVLRVDSIKTEIEKLALLKKLGFPTLFDTTFHAVLPSGDQIVEAVRSYMASIDRLNLPYDIDGIVFKLNNLSLVQKYGYTDDGRRPKANRAVKFPCEQAETTAIDLEINMGRTGRLNLTGILTPVLLMGTTITRIAFHNLKFMKDYGIKKNCKILIQKSGDIIPYVIRVTQPGTEEFTIPSNCPSCGTTLVWDDTQTTLWCTNKSCSARIAGNIEHWFKKLGVRGIGPEVCDFLVSNGYVKKISDMYLLANHKSRLSEQWGPKRSQILLDNIASVQVVPLETFINALGIQSIGRMAKDIVAIAPTIQDIDKLTAFELNNVDGFGPLKSSYFLAGWTNARKEIDDLLKYVKLEKKIAVSNKLTGKKFCFTGSFRDPSRGNMEKMVEENGGKLGSVSKGLTALVWDGEIEKGKYQKAKQEGIPVISQQEFLAML